MTSSLNNHPVSTPASCEISSVQQPPKNILAQTSNESWIGRGWHHFTSCCTLKNMAKVTLIAGIALASYSIFSQQNSPKQLTDFPLTSQVSAQATSPITNQIIFPCAATSILNNAGGNTPHNCPSLKEASPHDAAHALINPCNDVTTIDERIASRIQTMEQQRNDLNQLVENTLKAGGKIVNAAGNGQAGTSGVYFIKDKTGKTIAFFKPEDEGTWKHNNPNPAYRKAALTKDDIYFHQVDSWEQGKSAERQLLAEMLYKGSKTAPPRGAITELTSDLFFDKELHAQGIKHPITKRGYLQEWVHNAKPIIRYHPSAKNTPSNELPPMEALHFHNNPILSAIPLDEFQEIGINDLLLINEDRNTGNLLVTHDKNNLPHLVPIDNDSLHPWKLKKLLGIYTHDNAEKPFTNNALKMIHTIDPDFIEQIVGKMELSEQAPINAKAAALVVKRFVAAGATMRDLYNFMATPIEASEKESSKLWKMLVNVHESAINSLSSDDKAMYTHYEYLRRSNWCKTVQEPWCKTLPSEEETSAADWSKYYQKDHADRIQAQIKKSFWKEFDQQLHQAVGKFSERAKQKQNCVQLGSLTDMCWKRSELAQGVGHYKFEGTYDSLPQRIELLKIDRNAKASLKVKDARGVLKPGEKPVFGRLHLTDIAARVPNAVAAISGGNFHYTTPPGQYYEWDGPHNEGDPVGEVVVNGKTISENPKMKYWGSFRINKQGYASVVDTNAHLLKNEHNFEYALGGAPLLVNNGVPITSTELGPGLSLKPKQASAPGIEFKTHIHMQHARVGVCLTKNKEQYLVTVEGRQKTAAGLRIPQFARFLKALGCQNALNLDGGGTANLVTKDSNGEFVSTITPSDSKGKRPVATAIVVTL